jgi:hypothetical protein
MAKKWVKSNRGKEMGISPLCEISPVILLKSLKNKLGKRESGEKARFPQSFTQIFHIVRGSGEVGKPVYKGIYVSLLSPLSFPYFLSWVGK